MTISIPNVPHVDRRRKPFATFIKRLTNLKNSSHNRQSTSAPSIPTASATTNESTPQTTGSGDAAQATTIAPSTASSNGPLSFADTGRTTDTSPAPSLHSLTTLTTVQSTAPPSTYLPNGAAGQNGTGATNGSYNPHASHHHNAQAPVQLFSHQYPSGPGSGSVSSTPIVTSTTSTPLMSTCSGVGTIGSGGIGLLGERVTYNSATNNGMLTDNASILTLASSSKQHRRRGSIDTDASIRALPPSSLWGGSKESLPLSVLSGGRDRDSTSMYMVGVVGPRGERERGEGDDGRSMRSKRLSLSGTVASGKHDEEGKHDDKQEDDE